MSSFNRVILLGNLTRDVELRHLQSGTSVADIGLAVNDRRKSQSGEWIEECSFFDVTLWGRTAEIASEYLSKGSPVLIEGRLKQETWEKDGQNRSKVKVIAEKMRLIGGRDGNTRRPSAPNEYAEPAAANAGGPPQQDDIPF